MLAAFLEVQHELHGDASVAGPPGVGWIAAVSCEVPRIIGKGRRRHPKRTHQDAEGVA